MGLGVIEPFLPGTVSSFETNALPWRYTKIVTVPGLEGLQLSPFILFYFFLSS